MHETLFLPTPIAQKLKAFFGNKPEDIISSNIAQRCSRLHFEMEDLGVFTFRDRCVNKGMNKPACGTRLSGHKPTIPTKEKIKEMS